MIYLNGQKLDFETFPNGETLVNGEQIKVNISKIGGYTQLNVVTFKYESDTDLIKLMLLKKHIERNFAGLLTKLEILYMPYSRMDRVEGDSVFTLKYVADFINRLKFDSVLVFEPHSDVSMALLENSSAVYPTLELLDNVCDMVGFNKNVDYLFFPDAGAAKRYAKLTGFKTAVGHKSRDFSTGKITSFEVVGVKDLSESKVIIVDDLCSYGGTFLASGKGLRNLGAKEVYLFVAHCEESIFQGEIFKKEDEVIDKIFTTNSILDPESLSARIQIGADALHVFNII